MAFSHGSNDAQKTMGIMTLALFAAGVIPNADIPIWVIVARRDGDLARDGRRRLADHPDDGPAGRQARAGPRLRGRDDRGHDHLRGGALRDAGLDDPRDLERDHGRRVERPALGVRWGVAGNILIAWILTIPASGLAAAVAYFVLDLFL